LRTLKQYWHTNGILHHAVTGAPLLLGVAVLATLIDLQAPPKSLPPLSSSVRQAQYLDRHGNRLTVTRQNRWNIHNVVPLHDIPLRLQQAVILAEDKRFYEHRGVDWRARLNALWQNIQAGRIVRGASTLTEQVVRILHPRPRHFWSRWMEGLEAMWLETSFNKATILEFYLNQVPYARQRRGVAQAALDYFDRDLNTLNLAETLTLAVLIRAPGRLDLRRSTQTIAQPLHHLTQRMYTLGLVNEQERQTLANAKLKLSDGETFVDAAHYVSQLKRQGGLAQDQTRVLTTLDANLQNRIQTLLDNRLQHLARQNVNDGAVVVVDHLSDHILAWVNGGGYDRARQGGLIDAITTPRQPGSTLKPFLYAMALEKGWTAATLINDSPLSQPVGRGLHRFRNYSQHHYGPLRLRDALANSLNIPAVRSVAFVGHQLFLQRLHRLGFASLKQHPDFYGDGLALGNGEVTLLELVSAFAVLARGGIQRPLRYVYGDNERPADPQRIFSPEVSSLITDILADAEARRLEFGQGQLLRFPTQVAVKTGTSTNYRDAWILGFSHRYTVGVWMGNLDQRPMHAVSGSAGPALVMRSIFAELTRQQEGRPLYLSRSLQSVQICRISGQRATATCPAMNEWFRADNVPSAPCPIHGSHHTATVTPKNKDAQTPRLEQPTPGLQLAMDPRIPDQAEHFLFRLANNIRPFRVEWLVDGRLIGTVNKGENSFLWPLKRGQHHANARVWVAAGAKPIHTPRINFSVK